MTDKDVAERSHLTYDQAASFLGLPRGTLYSLVHRHEIPHLRLGRRLVRFSHDALVHWLAEHSVPAVGRSTHHSATALSKVAP